MKTLEEFNADFASVILDGMVNNIPLDVIIGILYSEINKLKAQNNGSKKMDSHG